MEHPEEQFQQTIDRCVERIRRSTDMNERQSQQTRRSFMQMISGKQPLPEDLGERYYSEPGFREKVKEVDQLIDDIGSHHPHDDVERTQAQEVGRRKLDKQRMKKKLKAGVHVQKR